MAYTNNQLHVIYGDGSLGLQGANFHYLFSYERGGLESLVVNDKEWLYRTPTPIFWRATTDNDHGSGFSVKSAQWYAADKFSTCQDIELTVDDQPVTPLPIAPLNNNTRITKSPRKSLWLTTSLPRPFLVPSSQ